MERLTDRLSRNIKRRRGDQTQMAFAKTLGIAVSSLNRIEQGTQNVTIRTIERLCRRLNCEVGDLFS